MMVLSASWPRCCAIEAISRSSRPTVRLTHSSPGTVLPPARTSTSPGERTARRLWDLSVASKRALREQAAAKEAAAPIPAPIPQRSFHGRKGGRSAVRERAWARADPVQRDLIACPYGPEIEKQAAVVGEPLTQNTRRLRLVKK
jgi:hypothetical protein